MIEKYISKQDRKLVLALLSGIVFGFLITISIKYPLTFTEIEKAQKICKDQKIEKMKIGISGKISEIKCSDGITFLLGN